MTTNDDHEYAASEPLVRLGQGETETEYTGKTGCGSIMWPISIMVCVYFLAAAASEIWGK